MRDTQLLQLALNINSPWFVAASNFDAEKKRLDIEVDFKAGARFACPDCKGADCPVHDTTKKTWRHLDFFQHQAFLHARTPRINCTTCGVKQVDVPWARKGSGFSLLFEALAMTLIMHMPVAAAARILGEHDTKLWRVVHHYVEAAVDEMDLSALRRVCIDETAAKRGHNYITLFVDIDARRVVYVAEGRGAKTIEQFADHVDDHNSDASRIKEVCIDMSAAYIAGVTENLTEAEITFDRFHVMKLIGDAVDKVRRTEVKSRPELKGSRYLWLKNDANLSAAQTAERESLAKANLKTGPRLGHAPRLPGHLQGAEPPVGRVPVRPLVLLGEALAAAADEGRHNHTCAPSRRHSRLVRQPHRQRPHRGHQLTRASGQSQGARLPHAAQPQGRHLPRRRKTPAQPTHLKQRGARKSA